MAEWGKLYGSLHDDPKWRSLTKGSRALWATANSWCIDHHKTNGHVPAGMLAGLDGTRSEAARLTLAGLWHEPGHSCGRCPQIEDGWQFHDWTEHQRSADQVQSDREATAERQRRARERRGSRGESRRDSHEGHAAREEERREEEKETPDGVSTAPAAAGSRRKPERPIPDDWAPTDKHREQAQSLSVDADREAYRFRNHAQANDRRARDWDAAFRNWLDRAQPSTPAGRPRLPRADGPVLDYVDRW